MDAFIIVYNADSDFVVVYTEDEVKSQIESLIKDGYGKDDIELFGCKQLFFEVTLKDVDINIQK